MSSISGHSRISNVAETATSRRRQARSPELASTTATAGHRAGVSSRLNELKLTSAIAITSATDRGCASLRRTATKAVGDRSYAITELRGAAACPRAHLEGLRGGEVRVQNLSR